jgi:pyrroline-5-carboxylate reductase
MKYGFIGCGNMGSAVAGAVAKSGAATELFFANRTQDKALALADRLGGQVAENTELGEKCDVIFLCVKPQVMPKVLAELQPVLATRKDEFLLVSMAAGLSISQIRTLAGLDCPVIRMMPNTPVFVGDGMTTFCSTDVPPALLESWLFAMAPSGQLDELSEEMMDAATCVAGCGPAFVYQFIEALADGGVAAGLPRTKALSYAAQMVLGSAEMVLKTGQHPAKLKDAVCSPGGSTIEGVRLLEERAFRGAVTDAVLAALDKTRKLGKKGD